MARNLAALAAGILFGLGLAVSQMVNPAKVKAFLDIAGNWDPSLILVMAGAVAVAFVAFRPILKRPRPAFDTRFHVSEGRTIDARLIGGAAIFGVGWGLVGFCPGPAIASLAMGRAESWIFLAAMAAGFGVAPLVQRLMPQGGSAEAAA